MRTMPPFITDEVTGDAMELARCKRWHEVVAAYVAAARGSPLSDAEQELAERMAAHNWSVRIAVDRLLGRMTTFEEWEALRVRPQIVALERS